VDERTKNEYVNNLVNEKVYSTEAGYGLRTKKIVLDANIYYTLWKDKGIRLAYNNSLGQLAYANIVGMEALHYGFELEGKVNLNSFLTINFMFNKGNWRWMKNVSATLINENDLTTKKLDLYIKNLKVGDAPQTSSTLGMKVNLTKEFYLIADAMYYTDMYANFNPELRTNVNDNSQSWKMPSFMLFDFHAGYDFNVGKFPASIKGHVFNLFNKAYFMEAQDGSKHDIATSTLFYGYGRTFNVALNFKF
jgi:outer membrane receptor protein involved in Fe transport